jgi:hypothetical protein
MYCFRLPESRDRGFESHTRHECLVGVCVYSVCVVLCLGRGLPTSWSLVQGVLPSVNDHETKKKKKSEARAHGGCRSSIKNSLYWFCTVQDRIESRDSAVGIATGYGLDGRGVGVRVPVQSRIFCSPRCPDRLWDLPSLLSNGYRGLYPRG